MNTMPEKYRKIKRPYGKVTGFCGKYAAGIPETRFGECESLQNKITVRRLL